MIPSGLHRTWKLERDENGAEFELWTYADIELYQVSRVLFSRLYSLQMEHGLGSIPEGSMSVQGVRVLKFGLSLRG